MPPSTDATPRMTPSDWSVERVMFSRISTQALRRRSRNLPVRAIVAIVSPLTPGPSPGGRGGEGELGRFLHLDEAVHDLDLALRHGGDREVVRDDDDRVAVAVEVGEELEDLVAGPLVE